MTQHDIAVVLPAYRPRRKCVPGDSREGQGGYPADDQPEPSVLRCRTCGWAGYEDELVDGDCPNAGGEAKA